MPNNDPFRDSFPIDGRLSTLIGIMCDGTATPEDRAELETLLADGDAQRAYLAFAKLNSDLRWRMRRDSAAAPGRDVAPSQAVASTSPSRRGQPWPGNDRFAASTRLGDRLRGLVGPLLRPAPLAMLVAALVGGSLTAAALLHVDVEVQPAGTFGRKSAGRIVAQITGMHDARWRDLRRAPDPRLGIARGTELDLAAGHVEVMLASGARLLINGPARLVVRDASAVQIHAGSVAAVCEDAHPADRLDVASATAEDQRVDPFLVVETPTASVTPLGTEFGVRVTADGASDVVVYKGLVDLEPLERAAARGTIRLGPGDAKRVDAAGRPIALERQAWPAIERRLPAPGSFHRPPEWVPDEAETIYHDQFQGGGVLAGRVPADHGGVGRQAWQAAGSEWRIEDGRLRTPGQLVHGTASLPFVPEAGAVYRLSATVHVDDFNRALAIVGFLPTSRTSEFWAEFDGGCAWMAQRPRLNAQEGNFASGWTALWSRVTDIDAQCGTHERTVQLDTRGLLWRAKFFVDGEEVAWFVFDRTPPISFASIGFRGSCTIQDFRLSVWRPKTSGSAIQKP